MKFLTKNDEVRIKRLFEDLYSKAQSSSGVIDINQTIKEISHECAIAREREQKVLDEK
ncbi:MAG: hypothetical protein FWF14_04365 [Streptococcaceae bacterium]|nr:hypothetical protein [Streptococcaceae bacterium]